MILIILWMVWGRKYMLACYSIGQGYHLKLRSPHNATEQFLYPPSSDTAEPPERLLVDTIQHYWLSGGVRTYPNPECYRSEELSCVRLIRTNLRFSAFQLSSGPLNFVNGSSRDLASARLDVRFSRFKRRQQPFRFRPHSGH